MLYSIDSAGASRLNRVLTAAIVGGPSKVFAYDAIGNITSKSDVGTYSYPTSGTGAVRDYGASALISTVNTAGLSNVETGSE